MLVSGAKVAHIPNESMLTLSLMFDQGGTLSKKDSNKVKRQYSGVGELKSPQNGRSEAGSPVHKVCKPF